MKKSTVILFKAIGLVATASCLSSCGMLVKDFEIPGVIKLRFPEGYSVGASANTIDEIDDRKGLNRNVVPLRKQITKEEY